MCQAAMVAHWMGSAPTTTERRRRLEALRAIGHLEDGHWVYPGPETVALIHGWGEHAGFTWVPGVDPDKACRPFGFIYDNRFYPLPAVPDG